MVTQWRTVMGAGAPTGMLAAQVWQESNCREGLTSGANARGLTQFIDPTADLVEKIDPMLRQLARQSPRWAFRAQAVLMQNLFDRHKAFDACERWAKSLASYNQGERWTFRAEQIVDPSAAPYWFGGIETINPGKSTANYRETVQYVRRILVRHEPLFVGAGWTPGACH